MQERQLKFVDKGLTYSELIQKKRSNPNKLVFFLDRLTDVKNIGSLFRIADAANIEAIYSYGVKPFLDNKRFQRVARLTHRFIEHHHLSKWDELMALKENYQLICLEITDKSIPYTEFTPQKPVALIIGNEITGVSAQMLALSEQSIHIPMLGINNSMNVSSAAAVATYHIIEQLGAWS